ncbi:MAG: sigma-70 family RNA polymerase sigma factor [Gemmataceae bacterium]|nr:sigma-70 family RNA polymerase sigma factor [Gemmataceae bacterium]
MSERSWLAEDPERVARATAACNRLYNRLRAHGLPATTAADLAADTTQTAFVKAQKLERSPNPFADERHLVNWLALVAYRAALDELRRRSVRPLPPSVEELLPARDQDTTSGEVWACLQQLDRTERQVLLWYYYDSQTDVQIGQQLFAGAATESASGQRARKLRLRALDRLRELLVRRGLGRGEDGVEPEGVALRAGTAGCQDQAPAP